MNHFSDVDNAPAVTREDLLTLVNSGLAREFQALISYLVNSQALEAAQDMQIASRMKTHAAEELAHALIIAGQTDYLGGMSLTVSRPVETIALANALRVEISNIARPAD